MFSHFDLTLCLWCNPQQPQNHLSHNALHMRSCNCSFPLILNCGFACNVFWQAWSSTTPQHWYSVGKTCARKSYKYIKTQKTSLCYDFHTNSLVIHVETCYYTQHSSATECLEDINIYNPLLVLVHYLNYEA